MTLPLFDDAAPSGNGAGVNGPNIANEFMHPPLTPPAHRNAPAGTSDVAARRIAGCTKDLRSLVLGFILAQGLHGATDDEGEAALGLKPQTYTPRRNELVKLRMVADSGERRPTESGRPAAVWKATHHVAKPEGGAR